MEWNKKFFYAWIILLIWFYLIYHIYSDHFYLIYLIFGKIFISFKIHFEKEDGTKQGKWGTFHEEWIIKKFLNKWQLRIFKKNRILIIIDEK